MNILKMNKLKIYIIIIFLIVFGLSFKANVNATSINVLEITNVAVNENNKSIKYIIYENITSEYEEIGILLSRTSDNINIYNEEIYKYSFSKPSKKIFTIEIKIPEYAYYRNLYAVIYILTSDQVIYSNKVCTSYAKLANLDKVSIKEYIFKDNSLKFTIETSLENNAEYGLIFAKSNQINELSLENAEITHFETEIIKLDGINNNNEYFVTIKDIPIYDLNITFKVCAYVKNNDTKETFYTKTYEINIYDLYFTEIINNIEITYNDLLDGIKLKTSSILLNNNDYEIGLLLNNKIDSNLSINSKGIYHYEVIDNNFILTIKNIPDSKKNENLYIRAYIKYKNKDNNYSYYYSDIYITSLNELKETYLTNN